MRKILVVIPARGGSKGIPHKNIKELAGNPLICYSIDIARRLTTDENICVTTDDNSIISIVENYGLKVPFKRPSELATDHAGTSDVLVHALQFYENMGLHYDCIVLLQPTSPFRTYDDVAGAISLYTDSIDMVASVKPASCNPYYDGYEDDAEELLTISKGDGTIERRQDAPRVWQLNGAVYVINPESLKNKGLSGFTRIRKYVMDELHSLDLDTMFDWKVAELILKENLIKI